MRALRGIALLLLLLLVAAEKIPITGLTHIPLPEGGGGQFSFDSKSIMWVEKETFYIWDIATRQVTHQFPVLANGRGWYFTLSVDGKLLATRGQDKTTKRNLVSVYALPDGKLRTQIAGPSNEKDSYFCPCAFNGNKLYTRNESGVQAWDITTGKMIKAIVGESVYDNKSDVSPNGQWFSFDSADASFTTLVNMNNDTLVRVKLTGAEHDKLARQHNAKFGIGGDCASFSGDGKAVYMTDQSNGLLMRWSLPDGRFQGAESVPGMVFGVVSADEKRLLAWSGGAQDGNNALKLFDTRTMRAIASVGPTDINITHEFSPDGRYILVGGGSRERHLYEAALPRAKK